MTVWGVILREPLNEGRRLKYLRNYLVWHLFYKHSGRKYLITLENGFKSLVYPYPDHDAGEINIYTRNVDYYDNEFIRRHLSKGDFIVDAGCNVGNRTWVLADVISGALMIDANWLAVERAIENMNLNQLDRRNYLFVSKAVGESIGIASFTDLGGASTVNRIIERHDEEANVGVRSSPVEVTTIDRELGLIGKKPSFMKVDVEGRDLAALRGAIHTLTNGTVRLVKFEHNQSQSLVQYLDFFNSINWKVFALNATGQPTSDNCYLARNMNLFAVPHGIYPSLGILAF